jgi:hypothetical protein
MTKLLFIFFLTITLQGVGQTTDVKSSKLVDTWLLKEFNLTSSDGDVLDSLKTTLEFKENGIYTIKYNYYYKDHTKANKPIVTSGKWKINWDTKILHLYASNQESPYPHQIPDRDAKIIKLNKKQFVISESLNKPKRKSVYTRQTN